MKLHIVRDSHVDVIQRTCVCVELSSNNLLT